MELEEFHSIDEQIIPFIERQSSKQYIPKKPKPWRFKVWIQARASDYVYWFELYQGFTRQGTHRSWQQKLFFNYVRT